MTYIEQYLASRGYVIWPGVVFDLTDPKECEKAAAWYSKFTEDFNSWARSQQKWADLPG